ncbi:acyltransferase [Alistipes sp.]|uniref:acyltransferase n=1 Tax=Alistipes sp. TaxID=1872444 RepID=UPI003AEF41C0
MRTWINYLNGIVFRMLPETKCFAFKAALLRVAGARIGTDVRICSSAMIVGNGELIIGSGTWIGHQVLLSVTSKIEIGACVDIAPQVYIGTGSHELDRMGAHSAGKGISKDISIGNGAWLCTGSKILPGVHIGEKTVVAAGAIVLDSCSSNILIGGIPAKKIKDM